MGHFVRKALEIQRDLGDPVLIAEINSYLGYFYMLSGEYTTALQVIEEQAANMIRIKNRYSLLSAKQNLSNALLYAGQYDQAHELSTQAAALVPDLEPVGDPQFNQFILTLIDLHRGEYTAVLQEAAFGGKAISKIHQVDIGFLKAQIYLLYGEWDQAEMGLKGFYDLHRSFPHLGMIGLPLALLGYIEYRRGNFKGALDNEEVALVIGLEQGYFLVNLYSLAVLALMAAEAGELEEAVELYATVTAHPCAANSRLFIDLFGNPLSALTADLPEAIRMAARERGSRRSLASGGNEYLEKLRVHKGSFENLFLRV